MQEKRSQRRLGIEVPIQVSRPGSHDSIVARYQDISWGGASFFTSDDSIQDRERLLMHFPWTNGKIFSIQVEVVRRETLDSGNQRVAVRFASVSHQDERRLQKLLELLATNSREASRTVLPAIPSLELVLDDEEEMREKLSQIAEGYLLITAFGSYRVGQSLLLLIDHTKDFPGLRLRARINAQSSGDEDDNDRARLVNLELGFEHPLEELRELAHLSMRFWTK
jgi:hypothetical protein